MGLAQFATIREPMASLAGAAASASPKRPGRFDVGAPTSDVRSMRKYP